MPWKRQFFQFFYLDALTQGGVFLVGRRVAFAHFSYNNPILNYSFIGFGIILLFAGLF